MDAPFLNLWHLGFLLRDMLTALRDYGLAYPQHRANIIQYAADVHNWLSAQLPSAGNSETS